MGAGIKNNLLDLEILFCLLHLLQNNKDNDGTTQKKKVAKQVVFRFMHFYIDGLAAKNQKKNQKIMKGEIKGIIRRSQF